MLYPLKFKPVFKDYIWGGRNLEKFGKRLPDGIVAESWELSCHPDGMSIVENGLHQGRSLKSLVDEYGIELFGRLNYSTGVSFPLMVKLIDANAKLSVQVHPDDAYALEHEGEQGKNEMWYILDAKPGASLIIDVKPGVTKHSFTEAASKNKIEDCLNTIQVKAGDFINIPAGMVHAIGEGIILAEVQQNSNTTYRIYDYNRVDAHGNTRPLHLKKALDVIDFSEKRKVRYPGLQYGLSGNGSATMLVANRYFCVEIIAATGFLEQDTENRLFHIFLCVEGEGGIVRDNDRVPFRSGETILIPASYGKYTIQGKWKALKAYVPDLETDVFGKLQEAGFSAAEIVEKVSGLG